MYGVYTTLVLVAILFAPVGRVHCTESDVSYEAISQGMLTAFKRTQPLVLLRTELGLQVLTGNRTCFDNQFSLYYASESKIEYADYSTRDNYLVMVSNGKMCFKNLFKSDWNNAIQRDLAAECRTFTVTGHKFAISISRKVLFMASTNGIQGIALNGPKCIVTNMTKLDDVTAFHVTNFEEGDDLALVGIGSNTIQVFQLSGVKAYEYSLEKTDQLVDMSSDQNKFLFIVLQRNSSLVVQRFESKLQGDKGVIFMQLPKQSFISLSVSQSLVAVLLRDMQNISWLHLKSQQHPNAEVVYSCLSDVHLFGVLVVEQRAQAEKSFCEDDQKACQLMGSGDYCNFEVIFKLEAQPRLDEFKIWSEMVRKGILTMAMTAFCVILLAFFQILNNTFSL